MSILSRSARVLRLGSVAGALGLAAFTQVRDADACGGCFHPPPGPEQVVSSVITDHRMVFKISTTETILWDQIRYTGDPKEFAWVLPVQPGATIQLAHGAWMSALDASTQSTVTGPAVSCPGSGGGSSSGGGGGLGCASSATSADSFAADGDGAEEDAGAAGPEVQVVSDEVIGPYQAVTIHSTDGGGIAGWLTDNGFDIPAPVAPIIDAYTKESFDFIALKLRPGEGVRAMQPVRVVTQGADPTLPLRMVTAGVGADVGITLWVIGEGRYHPQNFPDAPIDYSKLTWDGALSRSNLTELETTALAAGDKTGWITEASIKDSGYGSVQFGGSGGNPSLYTAYMQQCVALAARQVPCDVNGLPPSDGQPGSGTGGGADAGADDAGDDAGTSTSPTQCTMTVSGCEDYDDYDVAMRGLSDGDVTITRLRADLPVQALSRDLVIEASQDQSVASPNHTTSTYSDPKYDPCSSSSGSQASPGSTSSSSGGCACRTTRFRADAGTWALMMGTAFLTSAIARRRRKR